jgi:hypothetical protein
MNEIGNGFRWNANKNPCWFATGVVNKKDFKFDLRIN